MSIIFMKFYLTEESTEDNLSAWDEEAKGKYLELDQCLVQQYSEFQLDGKPVNGTLTLEENFADNGKSDN